MIVTGMLIFWNELPEDLARCVRGLATVADRLVAVDGAYTRYPGATVRSPKSQEAAIRDTAKDVGIDADVVIPKRLWNGGVEKRAFALGRAAKGSDWVAALDADWVIMGDRPSVRAELEGYDRDIDVVSALLYTPPSENAPATGWHTAVTETTEWICHLYRVLPEMTVEKYHWWWTAMKGREKVFMWGPPGNGHRVLPATRLSAPYMIQHRTRFRTEEQILASRAFLNDRYKVVALTDQEDDMPELPRPEFDFETIPDQRTMRRHARRHMSARERHALRRKGL